MYLTEESGDYLRVDYNLKEKRVRLFVEIYNEGGNSYYSVIKNGRIAAERSIATGRSFGFGDKFKERAEIFSTIPNNEVIELINKNYGIGIEKKPVTRKDTDRKKRIEETKKRYFKADENPYSSGSDSGFESSKTGISIIDFLDLLFGAFIASLVFFFLDYNYIAMGVTAAFYGLSIGLIDMVIRNRPPVFIKMILFIIAGTTAYVYGYFLS